MYLCLGTFATVLNWCRKDIILQADFIARITKCVDPNSYYIKTDDRYKDSWEIKGEGPAANKLLHCTKNFTFSKEEFAKGADVDAVVKNFEAEVVPFISEDKKAKVIFALLDIIQKDAYIDDQRKEAFKKFYGVDRKRLLQQNKFVLPDFLGRTLLYTIYGDIDNDNVVGQTCVASITDDYIEQVFSIHADKYKWESATQTLALQFGIIFNIFDYAVQNFRIVEFIERVDPVDRLNFKYIENCERFFKYTEENIWHHFGPTTMETAPESLSRPINSSSKRRERTFKKKTMNFSSKKRRRVIRKRENYVSTSLIIWKIRQFARVLDDYTNYLGFNMRPLDVAKAPNIMVPICYKDTIEELDFSKEVNSYRQQLVAIGNEIYSCTQSAQ